MKRTRHSAEQIVTKLREADAMLAAGRSIAQVIQALGVSEQTFNRWRNQYGGMKSEEARRLKELEIENARLKKAVADLTGVENPYITPRSPWENGYAESFHSRLRDELLNGEVFADVAQARALAAARKHE